MSDIQTLIHDAWIDRALLKQQTYSDAVREVVDQLDKGDLRVAQPVDGKWVVNEWVKKAVVMYFPIQKKWRQ